MYLTEFYLVPVLPPQSIRGCIELVSNTLTLDNNADGAATLASVAGTLSNFATITRAGNLSITTSSGNGSISYTTNGSGDHIFKSTTGNVQINRPITTSAGDLTLNPTGSNMNFSSKNLTSVGSVVVSSSSTSYNALDLNAPAINTGTSSVDLELVWELRFHHLVMNHQPLNW